MATSPTDVTPPTYSMSVTEIKSPGLDATPRLGEGQTVLNPVSTLTRLSDGEVITLTDEPSPAGNVVTQTLRGPTQLDAGSVYLLRVTYTMYPSIDTDTMDLTVTVTD